MNSKNSISFIFQPLIVGLFILFLFQSCSSKKYIFEKKDYLTQQQHFEYNFSPRKVKTRQLTPQGKLILLFLESLLDSSHSMQP